MPENIPTNDIMPRHNRITSSTWPITLFIAVVLIQASALQMVSAQDLCGGIRNRFVCDSHNPALFHMCLGSNKYTMVCPGALHFNVKTQKCDWPGSVTCLSEPITLQSASPYVSKMSSERTQNTSTSTKTAFTKAIAGQQTVTNYRPEYNPQKSEVNNVQQGNLKVVYPGYDIAKSVKKEHSNKGKRSGRVYVNRAKLTTASKGFEPYMASYHRELSPSERMALKAKVAGLRSDKYGRSQTGNNSITSKVPIKTATTVKVRDPHFGPTAKAQNDPSSWLSNKISKTSKAHQKTHFNVETNSRKPHQTMSDLNMSDTTWTRKLTSSQGRPDQPSAAYLHRSVHPPNRKFRPRVSQQNQMPQKYSARLSPFRKSPWNSLARSPQNSDNIKATGFKNTNEHSRTISTNTAVQMHTTKQHFKPTQRPDTTKQHLKPTQRPDTTKQHLKPTQRPDTTKQHLKPNLKPTQRPDTTKMRKGISLAKTPWWNAPTSDAGSATSYKIKHSPMTYFQKWHKTVDSDDLKDSSVISHLQSKTEPKVGKRPHKRKYKPRNHVPKPSYNTRTPLGNGPNQASGKSTSPSNTDSQLVLKPDKSPTSKDGKLPWNTVNAAAASSDIKADAYQSNDLIENIKSEPAAEKMIVSSLAEDAPKERATSPPESPIEKYSAKRGGKCSSAWCKLPACRCVGSDIPGGLDVNEVPQIVMLTFDDSINVQNVHYYKELFNGTFKNPNGCPIKSTFFVSGDNSDYQMVKKLFKQGHEMASHTLSHRSPTTWWAKAGLENWEHEIVGMKNQLNEKAGVRLKDVGGMRAPFLQVGGDGQYAMLKENKFRYDSSMVTGYLYSNNQPPIWPFTLDTPPDSTTCNISPCPTRSYPGLWEVPLVRWYGSNHIACAMPDACTIDSGRKNVRKFMDQNFNRHYKTNRAPFGIFIHAAWFLRTEGVFEGLKDFLRSLTDKEDVWVMTVSQALDWVQHPVRLPALNAIESWAC